MTKLPKIKGLIDYPFTDHKSEMMDIFLAKNSKFCIGTSSGYWTFAAFFGSACLTYKLSSNTRLFFIKKTGYVFAKKTY